MFDEYNASVIGHRAMFLHFAKKDIFLFFDMFILFEMNPLRLRSCPQTYMH